MRFLKLTAFLLSVPVMALISCNGTSDFAKDFLYNCNTAMTGAQETPAVNTTAAGTIDGTYNKQTKTFTYKVSFTGLAKPAAAAHIHGTAEYGIAAGVLQTFTGFPAATAGSYSGSILIDGVKFLETELLAGRYYMNIHNATYPGGEIRGQIILEKR